MKTMQQTQALLLTKIDMLMQQQWQNTPASGVLEESPKQAPDDAQHQAPGQAPDQSPEEAPELPGTDVAAAAPAPLPIDGINYSNSLPSTEINKALLRPVEYILQKAPLTTITNAGKLAVLLSRECVFGVGVLRQCTPLGAGNLKGLPVRELHWIKQIILQRLPQYWGDVGAFETVWKKCQTALEHCCSGLWRK